MIKAALFDYGGVLSRKLVPQFVVRKLAKELKKEGIKVGIISNINLPASLYLKLVGGYRGFDPIVLSFREKITKPDAEIYKLAIKRLGMKPEEIIFIDNLEQNVNAAKSLGINGIRAVSSKQIVRDVKEVIKRENSILL